MQSPKLPSIYWSDKNNLNGHPRRCIAASGDADIHTDPTDGFDRQIQGYLAVVRQPKPISSIILFKYSCGVALVGPQGKHGTLAYSFCGLVLYRMTVSPIEFGCPIATRFARIHLIAYIKLKLSYIGNVGNIAFRTALFVNL